ncbi:hypothetical protein, partial [Myroides sp. LoEW2-1]|uniref:hypothetical protein n=1 Tax=Myroides sp. LoEW2-1 TaxID=2683192 RepID=UPI001365716D
SDDNTTEVKIPGEPEPPKTSVTLNFEQQSIKYKDYVELIIKNSDNDTNAQYEFSLNNKDVADVEKVDEKYYINALQIGEATLTVTYKQATSQAKIKVIQRDDNIDFTFISIIDKKHALPYLRQLATRDEQKAAEQYIDQQLLKYNSPYRRVALEVPEQEDYLNYISEKATEDNIGINETLYGASAQGYLVGYESLLDAREFIDNSLIPLGFKPLDESMYTTQFYAYTYYSGEDKIIVIISPYTHPVTNKVSLRYLTGVAW